MSWLSMFGLFSQARVRFPSPALAFPALEVTLPGPVMGLPGLVVRLPWLEVGLPGSVVRSPGPEVGFPGPVVGLPGLVVGLPGLVSAFPSLEIEFPRAPAAAKAGVGRAGNRLLTGGIRAGTAKKRQTTLPLHFYYKLSFCLSRPALLPHLLRKFRLCPGEPRNSSRTRKWRGSRDDKKKSV